MSQDSSTMLVKHATLAKEPLIDLWKDLGEGVGAV